MENHHRNSGFSHENSMVDLSIVMTVFSSDRGCLNGAECRYPLLIPPEVWCFKAGPGVAMGNPIGK